MDIEFVLENAPSIEGIVRDESGQPLEGVRLWGWPSTSGSGAGGTSDADGKFVVYLPQPEPYTLSGKLEGYLQWGDRNDKTRTFEPGTRGLEVVMQSLPRTEFRVVDAETGVAIHHFGLNILEDNGSESPSQIYTERRRPRVRDYSDGGARRTAREGIDLYVAYAEGYLLRTGDVAHDEVGVPMQTVRLRRGSKLTGRLLRDDKPASGVRIEVAKGFMSPFNDDLVESESGPKFIVSSNTLRSTVTDGQGRFQLEGMSNGVHRLVATPEGGAALVIAPLELPEKDHDLGDLILLKGGSLVGNVQLPLGVEPAGLQVQLGHWRDGVSALVDANGRFRFDELPPGKHSVALGGRPGILAHSESTTVEVFPEEVTDVTLDARDRVMCMVRLNVDLGPLPITGVQVDLVSEDSNERKTLGHCDKHGLVAGSVRAWGRAKAVLHLESSTIHHDHAFELLPMQEIEESIRFEFATLELRFPEELSFPEVGSIQLTLTSGDEGSEVQRSSVRFADGKLALTPAHGTLEEGRLTLATLLPGEFDLEVEIVDKNAEYEEISLPDGGFRFDKQPVYLTTQRVSLVANQVRSVLLK